MTKFEIKRLRFPRNKNVRFLFSLHFTVDISKVAGIIFHLKKKTE